MPLIFEKKIEDHTIIAVWQSIEPLSFFLDHLNLSESEIQTLSLMKDIRQKEWLTSRYLIHQISDSEVRIPVDKDYCGKPLLKDQHQHISISHSRDHIAIAYSTHCIGIDIQHQEQKIVRIKNKFISDNELMKIDDNHLIDSYHIFWGAKECMYKAYGKKELDFKKHMHLFPFKYYQSKLELKGWVDKDDIHQDYDIITDRLGDYYLVLGILQ